MKDYVIVTDVTSDIPDKLSKEYKIQFLPMGVTLGADCFTHYHDEREMPLSAFYERLRRGETASTAQVTADACQEVFRAIAGQNKDVLYIAFSAAMSGSYESGLRAREELRSSHPDCRVEVINSLAGCGGEGLLVYQAALEKEKGLSLSELIAWIERKKPTLHHWFCVQDLHHLKRGGRVSATIAVAGALLGIKPILHVDEAGRIQLAGKVRGWIKSIRALVTRMERFGTDNPGQTVFISHADCKRDAKTLKELVCQRFNIKNVFIHPLNPVAGCHVGAGALGLFFFGQANGQPAGQYA